MSEVEFKVIYESGQGEISEKKSRFIGAVTSVYTEEQAFAFIEAKKKQYWDASHNCYAYVIGEQSSLQRISDDGEPGGTAGKPMLDVLQGNGIHNAAVVVTRYFGGTLLGKGGLVRAYTDAAKCALSSAVIITRITGIKLRIITDYTYVGKIQYILEQNEIKTLGAVYTEKVEMTAVVEKIICNSIITNMIEVTNGQVQLEEQGDCFFAKLEKEIVLLN